MNRVFTDKVKTFLLLPFSCIVVLLILEIILRVQGYDPLYKLRDGRELIIRPSSIKDLRYELTPGASGQVWGSHVSINSDGYRGRRVSPGKHDNRRIIVLGDSITFGKTLPVEDVFPYQLRQLLFEEEPELEILNFGVGGYDIIQEIALLEHRGLQYYPDLVILGYCLNDVGIASWNLEYIDKLQARQTRILYHLRIVQFLAERIGRIQDRSWWYKVNDPKTFRQRYDGQIDKIRAEETELRSLMDRVPDEYPFAWYGDRDRIGRVRYGFRRLRELANEHDFSVVVVVFPHLVGNTKVYPYRIVHRILELECREAELDMIDLTDEFMRAGFDSLKLNPVDMIHPNKDGHAVIAGALSTYVRKQLKQKSPEEN